jgi:alkylhydroperoxidase/carboxymuconolactone decarboxylase family protein YurZ
VKFFREDGEIAREFQEFITRYAWGEIWARPGLGPEDAALRTLTAVVALGGDEELAMHVRAALRNGLTWEESRKFSCRRPSTATSPQRLGVRDRAAHTR